MDKQFKLFGAALDASDFPLSIQMKRGYLNRLAQNLVEDSEFLDPYDAFQIYSHQITQNKFIRYGKFPIDSWLTPKPKLEDLYMITQNSFKQFTNEDSLKVVSKNLEKYIEKEIFPSFPLMIGVDHSLTGGALMALSREFGAENLTVVIFDAHFDGLPASISINIAKYTEDHPNELNPLILEQSFPLSDDLRDTYTCASFLYYLIKDEIINPENLIIFGCQDYPDTSFRNINDLRIKEYVKFYDAVEEMGVKFIPKANITQMLNKLSKVLKVISNSKFYVSFDVDVGALKEIIATRFRNAIGLEESVILDAAKSLNNKIKSGNNQLVGFDIMEIETFLLNKEFPKSGRKDLTIQVLDNLLQIFFES